MHKENEKSLAILQCRNNQTLGISSFKIFSYMYMWRKQEREHFKNKEMITCTLCCNLFLFFFFIRQGSFQNKGRVLHIAVFPEQSTALACSES